MKTLFSSTSAPSLFFMLLWNSAIMAVWKIRIFMLRTDFGCFFLINSTTASTIASATAEGLAPPWPNRQKRSGDDEDEDDEDDKRIRVQRHHGTTQSTDMIFKWFLTDQVFKENGFLQTTLLTVKFRAADQQKIDVLISKNCITVLCRSVRLNLLFIFLHIRSVCSNRVRWVKKTH